MDGWRRKQGRRRTQLVAVAGGGGGRAGRKRRENKWYVMDELKGGGGGEERARAAPELRVLSRTRLVTARCKCDIASARLSRRLSLASPPMRPSGLCPRLLFHDCTRPHHHLRLSLANVMIHRSCSTVQRFPLKQSHRPFIAPPTAHHARVQPRVASSEQGLRLHLLPTLRPTRCVCHICGV